MKKLLLFAALCTAQTAFSQSLGSIEGVEYDHANSRFLVTNSSSIIAIDHESQELSYFGNGTASHGMEVMNNTLFAISGSTIKGYDLTTEEEVMSMNISGAGFLNGMASDGVGRLWVTDFSLKDVIEIDVTDIENPSYETVISNTGTTPNGIVYDETNDRLIFVSWGSSAPVKEVNLDTYAISILTETTIGNCDGIDNDDQDNYYVSSWMPTRITRFNSDFSGSPEIIEAPGLSSPADICYAKEIDTLAIPNSGNSTVTFIGFENTLSVNSRNQNDLNFGLVGNPISEQSYFTFTTQSNAQVSLTIFDQTGKTVAILVKGNRSPGEYKILMNGIDLPSGMYIATLRIGDSYSTEKMVIQ